MGGPLSAAPPGSQGAARPPGRPRPRGRCPPRARPTPHALPPRLRHRPRPLAAGGGAGRVHALARALVPGRHDGRGVVLARRARGRQRRARDRVRVPRDRGAVGVPHDVRLPQEGRRPRRLVVPRARALGGARALRRGGALARRRGALRPPRPLARLGGEAAARPFGRRAGRRAGRAGDARDGAGHALRVPAARQRHLGPDHVHGRAQARGRAGRARRRPRRAGGGRLPRRSAGRVGAPFKHGRPGRRAV